MVVAHQPRTWTRSEYDRMVEVGILGPEDRVELIEGEILAVSPQSSAHATAVQLVADRLRELFGPGFVVRVQAPLSLGERSEPEPDVAVVAGSPRDFTGAHPATAELVVEVADTSLELDRDRKQRIYAAAGIREYWLVDLRDRRLEVFREPAPGGFLRHAELGPDEEATPLRAPAPVLVRDLLP